MKLQSLLLLIVFALIAAFAALNWGVFLSTTELSLGYTTVNMPLGLIMLGLLAIVTTLFLMYVVYLQGSVLLEARRHSKELQANRELADQAEASRFTELRTFLDEGLTKQSMQHNDAKELLLARIDRLEHEFQTYMEQSGNTLAAYIGELEDRIEKLSGQHPIR
ncbi:MAG: Signal transduction histidine kinase [Methylophilales bacterium 16-45-9]|nr:MAG: Signal transduction histidine kinase [Methylophilales bacterium 16-45-9]